MQEAFIHGNKQVNSLLEKREELLVPIKNPSIGPVVDSGLIEKLDSNVIILIKELVEFITPQDELTNKILTSKQQIASMQLALNQALTQLQETQLTASSLCAECLRQVYGESLSSSREGAVIGRLNDAPPIAPMSSPIAAALANSIMTSQLAEAALASQRAIKHLQLADGTEENCCVVPAAPDGNCGFTAISRVLKVEGFKEISSQISRENFIELLIQLSQEEGWKELIKDVFTADNADDLADWQNKFHSRGYWMQEAHFRILSKYHHLQFDFYYILPEENFFAPEPSENRSICLCEGEPKCIVSLAHVTTGLRNNQNATLNHFEGILINPTEGQIQQVTRYSDSIQLEQTKLKVQKPSSDSTKSSESLTPFSFYPTESTTKDTDKTEGRISDKSSLTPD